MKQKMIEELLDFLNKLQDYLHQQHQTISRHLSCQNCQPCSMKGDLVQKEFNPLLLKLQWMKESRRISYSEIPSEKVRNLADRIYSLCEEHRELHLHSRNQPEEQLRMQVTQLCVWRIQNTGDPYKRCDFVCSKCNKKVYENIETLPLKPTFKFKINTNLR